MAKWPIITTIRLNRAQCKDFCESLHDIYEVRLYLWHCIHEHKWQASAAAAAASEVMHESSYNKTGWKLELHVSVIRIASQFFLPVHSKSHHNMLYLPVTTYTLAFMSTGEILQTSLLTRYVANILSTTSYMGTKRIDFTKTLHSYIIGLRV